MPAGAIDAADPTLPAAAQLQQGIAAILPHGIAAYVGHVHSMHPPITTPTT